MNQPLSIASGDLTSLFVIVQSINLSHGLKMNFEMLMPSFVWTGPLPLFLQRICQLTCC
jgi:hypothetical protein